MTENTPTYRLNPAHVRRAHHAAGAHYRQYGDIQQEIARRLLSRLDDTKKDFQNIADLGSGCGFIAELFPQSGKTLIQTDIDPTFMEPKRAPAMVCDAEHPLPFADKSFDLVISNLMLPYITNVRQTLLNAGKILKGDGLLLMSTLGPESFREFKQTFQVLDLKQQNHTQPLPDVRDWGSLLHGLKFALPVVDRDFITLTYPDFPTLYTDLKMAAARNLSPLRRHGLMSRDLKRKIEEKYTDLFAKNGEIPLTLEVIYLHGWRPHKSQQQPLKPGQGQVDLSEILGQET